MLAETASAIAAVQLPDGSIPYVPGGRVDPWDHVEAAMALDAMGEHAAAAAAYRWLAATQRPDGSWPSVIEAGRVVDSTADANFAAYLATGLWHHRLATGSLDLVDELFSTLDAGIEFALGLQAPGGEVRWARDAGGRPWDGALLTSCSSIHLSLRCAAAAADELGHDREHWEVSADRLRDAIRHRPHAFEDKSRFAMDWYYPVLGGAVTGEYARRRLLERWDEFVVVGLGCRCVSDRPWVTAAETSELVIALELAGLRAEAVELLSWVDRLRHDSGGYWTGMTFPDEVVWPREQPTWTSGAVILATAVLYPDRVAAGAATRALFSSRHKELSLETVA